MNCPTCGFKLGADGPTAVCPLCSLRLAGGLDEAAAPEAIEGYEFLRPIGRGAMGVVWLAREKRLDRLVAVKLIPSGGDPQLAPRLLREAQAAARLSHPHIVAVHALGGTGPSTYFAMDFEEGGNLEEHLQGRPLVPRVAAELAAKLAGALAHAHAMGILHRDLKPTNVLLSGAGEPLLSDFGLAGPLEGRGDLTRPGVLAGTPAYLAPELLGGIDRATPQTDIYGLGMILYVCLTGIPPFADASAGALLRRVANDEPVAPRLIRPGIPRDLETITQKCLEKSPARRYPTAAAVQDELGRFLRHEPIRARPVRAPEKALRWCRRHPGAATALALGAVILLLLAVGGPLVALRLERSRRSAADAAATATAIADFLQNDLLAQASPDTQPDRDLKLRTVLDHAAAAIETRFADRPVVEAAIRETLGDTYFALGEYGLAQHHFERALSLREPAPGAEPSPAALTSMNALASTYYRQGKIDQAKVLYMQVLNSAHGSVSPENANAIEAMNVLAGIDQIEGQYAEGEALLKEALALSQRAGRGEAPTTLVLMNNLASTVALRGDYAKAAEVLADLRKIRIRVSGPDHPDTLTVEINLAYMYRLSGRLAEADALDRQIVSAERRVAGPEHLFTLIAIADLALVCQTEGRLAEADTWASQALAIARRTLGAANPQTVRLGGELGEILVLEQQSDRAEQVLRSAIADAGPPGASGWRGAILNSRLGEALTNLHRFPEAEQALIGACLTLQRETAKIPIWNRFEVEKARGRLFRLYTEWGKPEKARAWAPPAAEPSAGADNLGAKSAKI